MWQVLPVSFFERCGNAYYNSLAMVDADGAVLGVYRKSHIPDSPGYMEVLDACFIYIYVKILCI